MSRQLSFSVTVSLTAMALFVLTNLTDGSTLQTEGAEGFPAAPPAFSVSK